jgi:hypothetical protein
MEVIPTRNIILTLDLILLFIHTIYIEIDINEEQYH